MTDTPERTNVFYDAIDAFQRTHRLPGLQHAQLRGLLAEHLARVVPAAPAVVEPPADQTALRDRIAEAALGAVEAALGDTLVPAAREEALAGIVAVLPEPADRAALRQPIAETLREHGMVHLGDQVPADEYDCCADAVLAVLPPPADRAVDAIRRLHHEWKLSEASPNRYCAHCEKDNQPVRWPCPTVQALDEELRRMADETATTETHACDNCEGVDPDTCFNNPTRPPEQCPRSEFEDYGQQCQKPAGHNLCTFEEQPAAGARQDEAQR